MPPETRYAEPTDAGTGGVTDEEMQSLATTMDEDKWKQVQAMLASLPNQQAREQWFKEYTANHGAGRIDAQDAMTRADALRVEQPGMQDTGRGFKVGSSPFAHLGAGMQNYAAQKQYKQGETDLAAANTGMAGQDAMTAKIMSGQMGPQGGGGPGAAKANIMRRLSAGGQPGRGAAPGGPAATMAGGPGRGAAPGGMPGGMTPEMLMMLRSR